jgi:hypothetical protein
MPNPTITFRLSPNQIARGLQVIRNLEPNYQLTSISKIVKTIYLDYLAKMTVNKAINVPQEYLDEVNILLEGTQKNSIKNFDALKEFIQTKEEENEEIQEEPSVINSVEDFSPPNDWDI